MMLEETLSGYREQYVKGNVSLKDYSRLEAAYLELSKDKSEILTEITEHRKYFTNPSGHTRYSDTCTRSA